MTLFRANFDYESELFWGKQEDWAVTLLEHLFFFSSSEKNTLFTSHRYAVDYLDHVKNVMGHRPRTSSLGEPENWWGKIKNKELEKKINSKVTSFEIANRLGVNTSNGRVVMTLKEAEDFFEVEKDVFFRHPYERAGRVSFRISSEKEFRENADRIKKILKGQPLIVDKYFENRKWDLGSCLVQNGGVFETTYQIKNLNDEKGVFRGAVLLSDLIQSEELEKIGKAYYELGARDFIQVDSFAHEDGISWLCEVNYRKTMGFVVNRLNRLLDLDERLVFLMTPKSWIKEYFSYAQLLEEVSDFDGIIPLSPIDSPLYCWMIRGESRQDIFDLLKQFWSSIASRPEQFPEVFNKILPDQVRPDIDTPI